MVELFEHIRQEVKDTAEGAWDLAIAQHTPAEAAELLSTIVEYYKLIWTEEEVEFLQFYFRMKMEMMKND
jgi:hypothetical protein